MQAGLTLGGAKAVCGSATVADTAVRMGIDMEEVAQACGVGSEFAADFVVPDVLLRCTRAVRILGLGVPDNGAGTVLAASSWIGIPYSRIVAQHPQGIRLKTLDSTPGTIEYWLLALTRRQ